MKKTLLQEVKAMNKLAGTQMTKEQEINLIRERLNQLNELEFGTQKAFDAYQKDHDMRGDTEVTVAGKKMSVTQAVKQSGDTDSKGKSIFGKMASKVFGNNKGAGVFDKKSNGQSQSVPKLPKDYNESDKSALSKGAEKMGFTVKPWDLDTNDLDIKKAGDYDGDVVAHINKKPGDKELGTKDRYKVYAYNDDKEHFTDSMEGAMHYLASKKHLDTGRRKEADDPNKMPEPLHPDDPANDRTVIDYRDKDGFDQYEISIRDVLKNPNKKYNNKHIAADVNDEISREKIFHPSNKKTK